jgi:hypothetical protein
LCFAGSRLAVGVVAKIVLGAVQLAVQWRENPTSDELADPHSPTI